MTRLASRSHGRLRQIAVPAAAAMVLLASWQGYVRLDGVPSYILPAPTDVAGSLVRDWPILSAALWNTLTITFAGLFAALAGGILVSILFVQSRFLELLLYPYAVILQVTPIVVVAPLIIIAKLARERRAT